MQNQQLFEQLIQKMVLTDYQKNRYGRYVLLSAHIHAMEESKIISTADVLSNLSEFTKTIDHDIGRARMLQEVSPPIPQPYSPSVRHD